MSETAAAADIRDQYASADNNQETSSSSSNNDNNEDGVMVNRENMGGGSSDEVVVEDAGREDMFLDASEDLGADGRESNVTVFTEGHDSGSSDNEQQKQFRGLDHNSMQNDYMVDEMERLRSVLDKTMNEKESMAREYKDAIEMVSKAIANLSKQMRGLVNCNEHFPLDGSSSSGLAGYFGQTEMSNAEGKALGFDAFLHEMVHECLMLLKSAVEDRTQAEGKVRELQASHDVKDQEIVDLNRDVAELSVSGDVVGTYLSSIQNVSSEAQLQKDQYIDDVANRILDSLASVVYAGERLDGSLAGKIAHVERSVFALMENYNWFLYETDQLRQQLLEVRPDLVEQTDYGVTYAAARDELLECKKKEMDFAEKLGHLEDEHRKLVEQLDHHKAVAEMASSDLERIKAELDQEKNRYANTKEKLSLAVTKGKALVQQRDSLKQTLADKTIELEKCLVSLQEKTRALEAAETIKEELVKSQISVASLQDMLSQRDAVLEKLEDILSQSGIPEGLKSMDVNKRTKWLVDENNALQDVSWKFNKLETSLLSIDLPQNFSFSDLDSRLNWLRESFHQAKAEIPALQTEIAKTREAAYGQIDQLTASLSTSLVERDYLEVELDDAIQRFEQLVVKQNQISLEKEQLLRMLVEASGVAMGHQEGIFEHFSDTAMLVEQCLGKIKEQNSSALEQSRDNAEILQSMQMLLYVRDQELVLCEQLLEEDLLKNSEFNLLLNDLRKASGKAQMLQEEKDNLKKDLERVEEKSVLLREKLSMAVKKGKGLFQERENLKQLIDEKNTEIEKLNLELQQQESAFNDCRNQNTKLCAEVECVPKLESDIVALKEQREQLEKDVMGSKKLLESVMEYIDNMDGIVLPSEMGFEEPAEKLKWLAVCFSESQAAKVHTEQELAKAKMEVEGLANQVIEAHSTIKSLEDAVSVAQINISQLLEEKRDLEFVKASVEEELRRVMEETHSKDSMLTEAPAAKLSLENALKLAETNISLLEKEKEGAQISRAAAEAEIVRVKEEATVLTSKLAEGSTTIKSLEDAVSRLESRVASLAEETRIAQTGRTELDIELSKLKEEANDWDGKLQHAFSTIKSLENALAKADGNISSLVNEKKAAEQDMSTLNAKLNACMEELAGTHGSLKTRSLELFGYLKDLELLVKDESIFSLLQQCCEEKLESMKEMDLLFKNIRDYFSRTRLENHFVVEEVPSIEKLLLTRHADTSNTESNRSHVNATEADDMSLYAQNIVECFHVRHKIYAEKLASFSSFVNEYNAAVLAELRVTSNSIAPMVEYVNSLKEKVMNMETDKQSLESAIATLEDDVSVLLSACSDAYQKLQVEADKHMLGLRSTSEWETETLSNFEINKPLETAEKLLSATSKVCSVFEQLEESRNVLTSNIEKLDSKLNETKVASEKATEERNLYQSKVIKLETDLEALQNLCNKLMQKQDEYQSIQVQLNNREVELSSLRSILSTKEQETAEALLWVSQAKNLLDNLNSIEITSAEPKVGDLMLQDSAHMKKLLFVIDNFTELQHQVNSLSSDKEHLQSTLATQLQESEKNRRELFDMVEGVERVVQKLGDSVGDPNSLTINELLEVLENLVMAKIAESENSKSKIHEQDSKLLESQKVVDELSSKIKVLEDSFYERAPPLEMLQERNNMGSIDQELAKVKSELSELVAVIEAIIQKLGGRESICDPKSVATRELVEVLEKLVSTMVVELENSNSRAQELDSKLVGSQKAVDELLSKVKVLEDSARARATPAEIVQERSIFEAPTVPPASEISEIEDVGSLQTRGLSPVPSAAHVRTMRKGSSDHIALDIDAARLINNEETDEDKGHVFKSLNTSGLIPIQGKMIADRVDGIWVSGSRLLMSRPRARLGLIAYWLLLHIWLLGTIL
ncbi:hypothetical protein Ancab_021295 [Ancistrocladus abbreviatus]